MIIFLSIYISCCHFFPWENDEDSTLLHRDDVPTIDFGALIAIDDVYVQLDESMFINDDWSNEAGMDPDGGLKGPGLPLGLKKIF